MNPRVARGQTVQDLGARVGRAVVYEDELEVQPVQRAADPAVELLEQSLLVVDRCDDAEQLKRARLFGQALDRGLVGWDLGHRVSRAAWGKYPTSWIASTTAVVASAKRHSR